MKSSETYIYILIATFDLFFINIAHIFDTASSVVTVKTISVKNEVIRDLNLHFNINLWLILHQYCLNMWYCLISGHSKDNFSEEWSHQRPNIYILIATYDLFFINIAFICWYCLICDHAKDYFSEEWSHQRLKFTF